MKKAIIRKTVNRRVARYCPVCEKGHVVDVLPLLPYRLILLPPEHESEAAIFVKCPNCRLQIGLKIE